MSERKNGREYKKEEGDLRIDYDYIDVADIMNQIKRKIAQEPKIPEKEFDLDFPLQSPYEAGGGEADQGKRAKIKKMLLKIMKPFSPFIKILILPVREEIMQSLHVLHLSNSKTVNYMKLLHNLSHNIVLELSRLKIEEENLELRIRIMEKDFRFLAKREKALEKEVFK